MKKLPSKERLLELLTYNEETGDVFRLCSVRGKRSRKGCMAGSINSNGYRYIKVDKEKFLLHRIVYKIMTGNDPDGCIDHIDGDRSNNSWENLRVVPKSENNKNMAMPSTNTSGHIGVSWDKKNKKWQSRIRNNGKTIHMGRFSKIEDAIAARKEAEERYGFHKNHGKRKLCQ